MSYRYYWYKYKCEPMAGYETDSYIYTYRTKRKHEADKMVYDYNPYCKITYIGREE